MILTLLVPPLPPTFSTFSFVKKGSCFSSDSSGGWLISTFSRSQFYRAHQSGTASKIRAIFSLHFLKAFSRATRMTLQHIMLQDWLSDNVPCENLVDDSFSYCDQPCLSQWTHLFAKFGQFTSTCRELLLHSGVCWEFLFLLGQGRLVGGVEHGSPTIGLLMPYVTWTWVRMQVQASGFSKL